MCAASSWMPCRINAVAEAEAEVRGGSRMRSSSRPLAISASRSRGDVGRERGSIMG